MPTFKTKDGKTVSFKAKGEKKSRPRRKRTKSRSRGNPRQRKVRTMARRTRRSHRGSSSSGLMNLLLGGAVAGFVGSMIPYGNYGKLGVALVAHKQSGILGSTAKALGTIGVANLVSGAGLSTTLTTATASGAKW